MDTKKMREEPGNAAVLKLLDEIERLRAEITDRELALTLENKMLEDTVLTLGTELRAVESVLDEERINVTHTAAEIQRLRAEIARREDGAEKMALKGIEMRNEIQRLISERNAFGLAIDRALSGIVPDEHPLRSRLVEIAAMRAQPAPSVPDEWREFLGDLVQRVSEAGDHTHWSFHREMVRLAHRAHQMLRRAQGAQTAPSVPDGWQPIETAPKDGTHVLLANKSGTRVADGMYGNYGVWSWPYVMVEPTYWRPMPPAPGAQENNDATH